MKPMTFALVLLVLLGQGMAGPTAGQTLGYSIASDLASDILVRIDLETGDFSVIGPVGTLGVGGLAMAADGTLYSVSILNDDLWRIDPATGDSTFIGPLGVPVAEDTGLTFDACGALWMFTSRKLYQVDPSTGDATFIHDFGEAVNGLTASGEDLLAVVRVGSSNRLATIDPLATTLSPFGGQVVSFSTLYQGLDFDSQGRLWRIFWRPAVIPEPWVSSIVSYDPLTGQALSIREFPIAELQAVIGGNLAITPPQGVCASPLAIPTISASGLCAFALLLGALGVTLIRRL